MRRPFLAYLLVVVLPAALTAAAGAHLATRAWQELAATSQLRVGRMALRALEADLEVGLPPSTTQVGRVTGYRTTLLRDGVGTVSTEPAPWPAGVDGAMLVQPEEDAAVRGHSVLVAPAEPPEPPLPLPLLLVTALLFLFASLAGWIQLAGEPRRGRVLSVLLLSAVPALAAWGFLVQADLLYRDAADQAERRDLTRALAVARLRGVAGDPAAIHRLTGFHAWRVRGGTVAEASTPGPAGAVAELPAPPSNFTSTGRVDTPAGEAAYVALRLPGDAGFTVAAAVPVAQRERRFSEHAAWAGAALAAWLLLAGAAVARKAGLSSGR